MKAKTQRETGGKAFSSFSIFPSCFSFFLSFSFYSGEKYYIILETRFSLYNKKNVLRTPFFASLTTFSIIALCYYYTSCPLLIPSFSLSLSLPHPMILSFFSHQYLFLLWYYYIPYHDEQDIKIQLLLFSPS